MTRCVQSMTADQSLFIDGVLNDDRAGVLWVFFPSENKLFGTPKITR